MQNENTQEIKNKDQNIIGRVIKYILKYPAIFFAGFVSLCLASVAVLLAPKLIGIAIDLIFNSEGTLELSWNINNPITIASCALIALAIARGGILFAQSYLSEKLSQIIAYDLRNELFDHLQHMHFAYHDQVKIGDIMSRATQDIESIRFFISMAIMRGSYILFLGITSILLMLGTSVQLALIAFIFMPIVAIQAAVVQKFLRKIWIQIQQLQGKTSIVLQENFAGQQLVKGYNQQHNQQKKFEKEITALYESSLQSSKIVAFNEPILSGVWLIALTCIFYFGAKLILTGQLTVGELVEFQLYLTLLQVPIRAIGFIINHVARVRSAGSRLFEILDAHNMITDNKSAKKMTNAKGKITFENVNFQYHSHQKDINLLQDISFTINPGEKIGIIGRTGSGKTTLLHLLPRFYDACSGNIYIDDNNINNIKIKSLRNIFGIVQQDVFLFPGTIQDNISYGAPDQPLEKIKHAAHLAQIDTFIDTLPEKYDTWVGENGVSLSGGQRQRISIARTLLNNPPVLILDDVTSSVDLKTELAIEKTLESVLKNKTSITVTHRTRVMKNLDQIIYLEDGNIQAIGKHQALYENNKDYRDLCQSFDKKQTRNEVK